MRISKRMSVVVGASQLTVIVAILFFKEDLPGGATRFQVVLITIGLIIFQIATNAGVFDRIVFSTRLSGFLRSLKTGAISLFQRGE